MHEREPSFIPSAEDVAATPLSAFMRHVAERTGRAFATYGEFEKFAIADDRAFWSSLLDWSELPHEGDPSRVRVGDSCETARFFPDLRLNYAECLLRRIGPDDDDAPALRSRRPERATELVTRGELRRRVRALAAALEASGVGPGTRVALIAHNETEAAVAMLASAAVGALICLTSTDLAAFATIARFRRTKPQILFCNLRSPYPDVERQLVQRVEEIVAALPSVTRIVGLDEGLDANALRPARAGVAFETLGQLIAQAPQTHAPWRRFAFDHPLFALFTSGTSGPPKCVVHGAGGTLIQNFKEMRLHLDVREGDRIFFQTSTGWVIWLLLMSNLSIGAEVVLNSRPMVAPQSAWEIVGGEDVTIFCTSPAYLQLCEASGYRPREDVGLEALRSLMTAGSTLYAAQQDWANANVKLLPIRSVYGSTDIAACFVLPSPNLPVYAGECQARSLGLDVRAARQGELGLPAPIGETICANPFPSRPLGFLDEDGTRFHDTYFARNPGAWTQGDFIEFTARGGARLHGRCDGVLNIRGVRIGPAEIYEAVKCVPEIAACLAIAQGWPQAPGGTRLVLLVALGEGITLGEALEQRIKAAIWRRTSPVHAPDVIAQVRELPTTHNGKLSERAAADAANGRDAANRDALRNPQCLSAIARHPALGRAPGVAAAIPAAAREPRSIEAAVAAAFERAFDRRPLGRDENFFDLGGDSLTAMKIVFALKRTLGLETPVTEIFHTPTIAGLAEALATQAQRDDHPSLVRLKDGRDAPPLFMIPGVDGSAMKLRRLALAIDHRGPVYGLQAKGASGEAEPLASIEEMADFYVGVMKSVQPEGPYALAGFSLGAVAALETARALRAAGDKIDALMLLDPPLDERWWPLPLWLAALARRTVLHAGVVSRMGRKRWRYAAARLRGFARHFARRYESERRLRPHAFDPDLPPPLQAVHDRALVAVSAYRPRFYDGALTLFVAAEGIYQGCAAGALWSRFAAQVRVEPVPGDHMSMITPSEHHVLAEEIARALARAGAGPRLELARPPATMGVLDAEAGQAPAPI